MSTHAVFHIPRSVCCGLLVHSSIGTYVSSLHLQAPVNSAAVNIHEQVLGSLFSVLLGISLGVELSSARVILCFNFIKNHQTVFHSCCTISHSHQQYMKVPSSLHSHLHLFSIFFFKSSHLSGCEVVSHCGFDLHFPEG